LRKPPVAGRGLAEHIDHAFSAAHVDAAALGIDENVIGVTTGLDLGHDEPLWIGKRHQNRGTAKDGQDSVSCSVDRHRKIGSCVLGRKRSIRLCREVDHLDLTGIRDIDKNPSAGFIDLKTLRMSLEPKIGDLGSGCRIDERERAFAVSHENPAALRVRADIIGVTAQLDTSERRKVIAAE
jgi:hypothetical protein